MRTTKPDAPEVIGCPRKPALRTPVADRACGTVRQPQRDRPITRAELVDEEIIVKESERDLKEWRVMKALGRTTALNDRAVTFAASQVDGGDLVFRLFTTRRGRKLFVFLDDRALDDLEAAIAEYRQYRNELKGSDQ